MSYRDLPLDMSQLPLSDPKTAADVVDLILDAAAREAGCLGLMICDADGIGVTPVVIDAVPADLEPAAQVRPLRTVLEAVADADGTVVAARGRPGTFLLTDTDRAWHDAVVAVCRQTRVRLLGAYVATSSTVRALPSPLEQAS